jgi:hypothetical protein
MLKQRWPLQRWFGICIAIGLAIFVVLPVWFEKTSCPQEQQSVWPINSQPRTDYEKQAAIDGMTIYPKTPNKHQPNADERYFNWPAWLCPDLKASNIGLIFFTYCLVTVGWFSMKSNEQTLHDLERADLAASLVEESRSPTSRNIRLYIHNFGRTRAVTQRLHIESMSSVPTIQFPIYNSVSTRSIPATVTPSVQNRPERSPLVLEAPLTDAIVFGFIDYADVFGNNHTARFCIDLSQGQAGIGVVGPPAWNDWN